MTTIANNQAHTKFILISPLSVDTSIFAFLASYMSPVVPRSMEISALRVLKEAWSNCGDFRLHFRRSDGIFGSMKKVPGEVRR